MTQKQPAVPLDSSQRAWVETLFRAFGGDVARLIASMLRAKLESPNVEDLVQATFANACRSMERVPRDRDRAKAVLLKAAENAVKDYWRRHKTAQQALDIYTAEVRHAAGAENLGVRRSEGTLFELVETKLELAPETDRIVLNVCKSADPTRRNVEVAQALGISDSAADGRIRRAVARINKELQDDRTSDTKGEHE